jgi:hypothetical protein
VEILLEPVPDRDDLRIVGDRAESESRFLHRVLPKPCPSRPGVAVGGTATLGADTAGKSLPHKAGPANGPLTPRLLAHAATSHSALVVGPQKWLRNADELKARVLRWIPGAVSGGICAFRYASGTAAPR